MNHTTRVLAAVALTGAAALSFSGAAQAQESNPLPVGDVTKEVVDVFSDSVAPALDKQAQDLLRPHGK